MRNTRFSQPSFFFADPLAFDTQAAVGSLEVQKSSPWPALLRFLLRFSGTGIAFGAVCILLIARCSSASLRNSSTLTPEPRSQSGPSSLKSFGGMAQRHFATETQPTIYWFEPRKASGAIR